MSEFMRDAELVIGGKTIKQGEIFELVFRLFDSQRVLVVPTVDQLIEIKIANDSGVVYETTAIVDDNKIKFTVSENIGWGRMRLEIKVSEGVTLINKYPSSGQIILNITQSLDDVGLGNVYAVTAQQMRSEITAIELTAGNALTKAEGAETLSLQTKEDFDLVVAEAGSSNPEIVLGRMGESTLQAFNQKTISSLAEKAEQDEVRLKAVKLELEDTSDTFISAITGGATVNVLSIPQDASVTPKKTTFTRQSKNKFNRNGVTLNSRIDAATGNVISADGWAVTPFIAVTFSTTHSKNKNSIVSEYNSSYVHLATGSNNAISFNTRSASAFVRISIDMSIVEDYQFEIGAASTTFEPFGVISENLIVNVDDADISTIANAKVESLNVYRNEDYPDTIHDITPSIETFGTVGVSVKRDYENSWGDKSHGILVGSPSAKTTSITCAYPTPLTIPNTQAVGMWFYVDNPNNLTSIGVQLGHVAASGYQWLRSSIGFKKGWNLFRHEALSGVIGDWQTFYRIRFVIETSGVVNVTIGKVFLEQPDKAKILFVEDGGYVEFLDIGYQQLKSRGIPTTWALNMGILGTSRRISEAQVDVLANDYMSEFSFHSWGSEVHSTMTSAQIAENAIKCMRWLKGKGLNPDHIFRAAITQNNAPNHAILKEIVEAYANAEEQTGTTIFPFENPYGVKRLTLHGMDVARIDEIFDFLKKTHSMAIFYTHGIGLPSTGGIQSIGDMTQANWDYFLSKIDTALAEGWIEGVTYDRLRRRYSLPSKGWGFDDLTKATM